MTADSEANKTLNGKAATVGASTRSAAAKARRTTGSVADRAKENSAGAAAKAKSSARAASAGLETGRQAVMSTAGKAASTATTAWTVVKHRKAVTAGAAAGVLGMAGGAFALGRRTATAGRGPLTRLTGGRI